MINSILTCVVSLFVGWIITHFYHKRSLRGAILAFESQSVDIISTANLSRKVSIAVEGKPISTLVSIQIVVSLIGSSDLTEKNFAKIKPALHFHNMNVIDIRTRNNDHEHFDIPIGRSDNQICIFNIRYFKRDSKAIFQIIGSLNDGESEVKCSFTEGQGIGVSSNGEKLSKYLVMIKR